MTHVVFVRHGETDWNSQRRYQGGTDTVLNATGQAQAQQLAPVLTNQTFDRIYSSDLRRVVQTAVYAGFQESVIVQEPRLREISFGKFEGLTWNEIAQKYPNDLKAWSTNRENNTHGGEKVSEATARIRSFYEHLRNDYTEDDRILCFAHGGSIAIFLGVALGIDTHRWRQFMIENTAITEISLYEHNSRLEKFNDTYHLSHHSEQPI